MKSALVTATVLLVLGTMCLAAPKQDTLLGAEASLKNLAREKRGLLSAIIDTVSNNEILTDNTKLAELKREKRGCFCGALRCSCDLSSGELGGQAITATFLTSKSSSSSSFTSSSFSTSSTSSSSSSSGTITYSG